MVPEPALPESLAPTRGALGGRLRAAEVVLGDDEGDEDAVAAQQLGQLQRRVDVAGPGYGTTTACGRCGPAALPFLVVAAKALSNGAGDVRRDDLETSKRRKITCCASWYTRCHTQHLGKHPMH